MAYTVLFFHVGSLFICTGTEALAFADRGGFVSSRLKHSKVEEVSIDRTHSKPHTISDLDKILLTPEIPKLKQEKNNNSWERKQATEDTILGSALIRRSNVR